MRSGPSGEIMKSFRALLALTAFFAGGLAAEPDDPLASAMRDAQRLVECMKAFDPECTAALTYTKFAEDRGMPREQMVQAVTDLHGKLKSVGAKYTLFDLSTPTGPYSGDGREYVFVPYSQILEAGQRQGRVRAFLIGVSVDGGRSWQFVDGLAATPAAIKAVMPSYAGQPLPPVGPLE